MSNNILPTLGLCRRAGKLVTGFDAVKEECSRPGTAVRGVITASDLSEKTLKEVRFFCGKAGIPVFGADVTMSDIGSVTGKKTGIAAITDEGLYAALTREKAKDKK